MPTKSSPKPSSAGHTTSPKPPRAALKAGRKPAPAACADGATPDSGSGGGCTDPKGDREI